MFQAVHVLGGVLCRECALESADGVENLINSTLATTYRDARIRRSVPDYIDRPDDEEGVVPCGESGVVRLLLGTFNHGCSGKRLGPEFREFLGRTAVRGLRSCPFEFQWWFDGLRFCVRLADHAVCRDASIRVYRHRDRPVLLPECPRRKPKVAHWTRCQPLYYLDVPAACAHELDFGGKQLGVLFCEFAGAMNDAFTFLTRGRESFSKVDLRGVLVDNGFVESLQEADDVEAQVPASIEPQRVHFWSCPPVEASLAGADVDASLSLRRVHARRRTARRGALA